MSDTFYLESEEMIKTKWCYSVECLVTAVLLLLTAGLWLWHLVDDFDEGIFDQKPFTHAAQLLGLILVAYLALRYLVTNPVKKIFEQVSEYEKGNIIEPLSGHDELSQLSQRLYETTQRLKGLSSEVKDLRTAMDEHCIVSITDREGLIFYVNDKFCERAQMTRESLIGHDHRLLNSGHHGKDFFQHLWQTLKKGQIWRGEIKNRAQDGSFYWLKTTMVPFLNDQGEAYQFVAISTEVSRRKRLELLVVEAAEHERHRIGRDIHDDLCQQLAAAKMRCGVLARQLASEGHTHAESAKQISESLGDATIFSRSLARGLAPVMVEGPGLMPAFQQLAHSVETLFGVTCRVEGPERLQIPDAETATHLFRIGQELVTNAAKHAHPSRIIIRAQQDDDWLCLEVQDDGRPFHPSQLDPQRAQGLGLHYTRLRADVIDAVIEYLPHTIDFHSGTLVSCSLKMKPISTTDVSTAASSLATP
jgi:two-component system, NarL family, sensor histidine kinase NreB